MQRRTSRIRACPRVLTQCTAVAFFSLRPRSTPNQSLRSGNSSNQLLTTWWLVQVFELRRQTIICRKPRHRPLEDLSEAFGDIIVT